MDEKIKTALGHVRASAQELHAAISDAAARQGGAVKSDVEAAAHKAKALGDAIKASLGDQNEEAKRHLQVAMTALEAVQRHTGAALKDTGQAFEDSVRQSVGEARACAQEVSVALAEMRSAEAAKARTPAVHRA
jgi:4-hydroxy-3-methylbut-2-en-1-yl diphosphate synthase IspG/GcpE